jgi:hypothetical protein
MDWHCYEYDCKKKNLDILKKRHIGLLKPQKGHSGSKRSLQTNRELFKHEISSMLRTMLACLDPGSQPGFGSANPFESESNPDLEPKHCSWKCEGPQGFSYK